MDRGRGQVIELRLNRAEEMFAWPDRPVFLNTRNYRTGVEDGISLLRRSACGRRFSSSLPFAWSSTRPG